jgi:hypothetical protein
MGARTGAHPYVSSCGAGMPLVHDSVPHLRLFTSAKKPKVRGTSEVTGARPRIKSRQAGVLLSGLTEVGALTDVVLDVLRNLALLGRSSSAS